MWKIMCRRLNRKRNTKLNSSRVYVIQKQITFPWANITKKKQLFFKRQLNLFSFHFRLLLCIKLSIQEIIGSRWSRDKKQTSERNQEWEKGRKERSIRELKSCISRQTVEMNHRCLSTEDELPLTAGWGSDLCQCVYDLLQRYNVLETRHKWHAGRGKSFKQRKGSLIVPGWKRLTHQWEILSL